MKKITYIHEHKYLTAKQVEKVFIGAERAFEMGCPLNRFITIHYDDFAAPKRPQTFITNLLEHTRKWLKRRGLPVSYVYTLENGKDKGIHVHMMIHIPVGHQVAYKRAMAGWLPFEAKRPKIVFKAIQYPSYGRLSAMNSVYGTLRYICKGIDPKTPFSNIIPKDQGKIMGRRWGVSKLLKVKNLQREMQSKEQRRMQRVKQ